MEKTTRDTAADLPAAPDEGTAGRFARTDETTTVPVRTTTPEPATVPAQEDAGVTAPAHGRTDYHGGFGTHSDGEESNVGTFATGADQHPDGPEEEDVGTFATGADGQPDPPAEEAVGDFGTGATHPPGTPGEEADRRFSEGQER